jgi:hypothetical protein
MIKKMRDLSGTMLAFGMTIWLGCVIAGPDYAFPMLMALLVSSVFSAAFIVFFCLDAYMASVDNKKLMDRIGQ